MKVGDLVMNTSRPGRGVGLIVCAMTPFGLDRFEEPTSFCVFHSKNDSRKWYSKFQLKLISKA